jgi:acetyl-CoA carboxylase biotin carboxyl carrier protein
MELQRIKALIDVMAESDLAELALEEGGHRIHLVRRRPAASHEATASGRRAAAEFSAVSHAEIPLQANGDINLPADTLTGVQSPLYGVLHLTPAPGAPAFVQVGDVVEPGQILCLIEAMKMFHAVRAGRRARIDAMLAIPGVEIDAGAVIFQTTPLP